MGTWTTLGHERCIRPFSSRLHLKEEEEEKGKDPRRIGFAKLKDPGVNPIFKKFRLTMTNLVLSTLMVGYINLRFCYDLK